MNLLCGGFDYFTALVLAALHANTVRNLRFAAVGALGGSRLPQGIMGTARCGALGGMSSFRIRHFGLLFFVELN